MLAESINPTKQVELTQAASTETRQEKETARREDTAVTSTSEDVELLADVLDVTQQHLQVSDVGLNFSVHGDTGRVKVSVTDKKTGDLIREIPPEGVLTLMAKLDEMMGIIFDEQA